MVLAMSDCTDLARQIMKTGETVGYKYPDQPQEVEMRGPTPVLDCLTPNDTSVCYPLPHQMDVTDGVELDIAALAIIKANQETNRLALEGYHQKVKEDFQTFYSNVSSSSLSLDNNLTLTAELIGHVDGTLTDLARNKLLSIFKGRARGRKKAFFPEIKLIIIKLL